MEVGLTIKDQYQVVEHIGRGGMADVWSARDQRLNRLVAIKTISQSLSTDVDPIALFRQEAQTIAQMEHPHILPIYDFGTFSSNLYIVMRYVTGGSLEDKLEERPLTLQETLQIGANIAKALDYAHANNVIHLDLKPPNILMDSSGSPYLADFGLATVLDKQGLAQNPGSGTLLYMAPEQLVAEVIDHRTDIYSFAVMIFHMLTGTLPFDGTVPLAIKQLQYQDRLPPLEEFDPNIPYQITDILRQGTEVEPAQRPKSLTEMVDKMQDALRLSTVDIDDSWADDFDGAYGMDSALTLDFEDAGLLEAADIYVRAKHVWAGGNGRFLLGVSHFMMMCDYYVEAETHELELDDMGMQMLLRGALEYDYQVEYWWDKVNDDTRRWVCLHTIRSESAPARIRALYRLETLPDDANKHAIPNLVASALAIETNKEAKLAALNVLGTRAQFLTPSQSFEIKTDLRGRLLSSTTRLGIEIVPQQVWRDAVYAPEIDLLIAKEALNEEDDDVSERAARIIGRIHSLTSLRFIADAQRQNTPHALRALAHIRDEAPYLPDVVNRQARLYAWVANTILRITHNPMELVLRFLFAMMGGSIAFGQHVFITFRSQALFSLQRWGNTLAVGLMMGLFVAILVMFADAIVSRLKGFWPNWLRLIFSLVFGLLFGSLVWATFTSLYLNLEPAWDLMRMGGLALAFGLIASTMFNLKSWQAMILSTIIIFLSIFAAYFNFCTQSFYCLADAEFNIVEGVTSFSMAPIVFIGFLVGTLLGSFIERQQTTGDASNASLMSLTQYGGLGSLLLLGLGSTVLIYITLFNQTSLTWDHVVLLFAIPLILSTIALVILDRIPRRIYMVVGFFGYGIVMLLVQNALTGIEPLIAPQASANSIDALFLYDLFWQAITVALPVSISIAFGAFAMGIFRDLRQRIGLPRVPQERNAWLTGILLYVMLVSGFITVFAPFSLHAPPIWTIEGSALGIDYTIYDSILWSIGWTILGAFTFIAALATWQWKRWGVNALLFCAVLVIGGVFLADYRSILILASKGVQSQIFQLPSLIFWGIWAVATGVLTVGAMRRSLWGAYGLVIMTIVWFIVFMFINTIGDSLTALAVVNVPLIAFAARFDWDKFQLSKAKEKRQEIPSPTPVPVPAQAEYEDDELMMDTEQISPETIAELTSTSDEYEEELSVEELWAQDPPLSREEMMETEIAPKEIDSLTEEISDMLHQAEFKAVTDQAEAEDKPSPEKSKPRLKIDTGALASKVENSPDSKASRKGFKIDTGLLNSKTDNKPDSKSSRKGLKIDTGLLSSKASNKPDSKSSRKGLKIDTGLLSSKADHKPKTTPDADVKDEPQDEFVNDDTLPSRKTTKLSTTEIKAQIEEEARQAREAAEKKPKSKPKFKLNTSRIKPDDKEDEEASDDE